MNIKKEGIDYYLGCKPHYAGVNFDIVNALLQADADVNAKDYNGDAPIHMLRYHKSNFFLKKLLKALLDAGADVNAKNFDNITPIYLALLQRNIDAISVLIDAKANINEITANGESPLFNCARHEISSDTNVGLKAIAKLLIDSGADVNEYITTARGSILSFSCGNWSADMVKYLLDAGANVRYSHDGYGNTCLHSAAFNNRYDLVPILIQAGAELEARDCSGATPLHTAAITNDPLMVQALVNAGADINPKKDARHGGYTPLQLACKEGKPKTVQALIDAGANVSAFSSETDSLLNLAFGWQHPDPDVLKVLFAANISSINSEAKKLFNTVLKDKDSIKVDLLLNSGIRFIENEGDLFCYSPHPPLTPLFSAKLEKVMVGYGKLISLCFKSNSNKLNVCPLPLGVQRKILNYLWDVESNPFHKVAAEEIMTLTDKMGNDIPKLP